MMSYTDFIILAVLLSLSQLVTCQRSTSRAKSYDELLEENEELRLELSSLREQIRDVQKFCSCPTCENNGVTYQYLETYITDDGCETCTCLDNGKFSCQVNDTRPICLDKCLSSPCYNGGTCVSVGRSGFRCICPPNCSGVLCEERDAHICSLPLDQGEACEGTRSSMIWYFDPLRSLCTNAEFYGCGGNSNMFLTKEACDDRCNTGTCCSRSPARDDLMFGHSLTGFDRYGFKDGFDSRGFPATTATATGFGRERYRFSGVDFKGYRVDGYNRDRYARTGFDCFGISPSGLNMDGLAVGFNYTCQVLSLDDCRSQARQNNSEVISFTRGVLTCKSGACPPSTDSSDKCGGCRYHNKFYRYEERFSDGCNQCVCTRAGSVQCQCTRLTSRKEIRDMTPSEVELYQLAIRKLYKTGEWTSLSESYSDYMPLSHSKSVNYLPWHRALLHHVENRLKEITGSCDIAIPYFDWTVDAGAFAESPVWRAGLFGGNGRPFGGCIDYHPFGERSPFGGQTLWSPCLRRQFNPSISLPNAVTMERVMRSDNFRQITDQLASASLLFRLAVGGHAATVNSIYDPVMLSHYAFMDKIWHKWQTRGSNYLKLYTSSRYRPLAPFGVSADDVNGSPQQICVDYAPLGSLCYSDVGQVRGMVYGFEHNGLYDSEGFDTAGYDRYGFHRSGFNADGYDRNGFDMNGFDRYGFNRSGYSKYGVHRDGRITSTFDPFVFDKQNFTVLGVDMSGLDFTGRDLYGYNTQGYDEDGCSGHFNTGYNYLRLKYDLELDLEKMNEEQLNKISRLCSQLTQPPSMFMIMSWVVVDPTNTLRGNDLLMDPPARRWPQNIWKPADADRRFCAEVNLFSPCFYGESYSTDCPTDLCTNSECPTYSSAAYCRPISCDGVCRAEWFHNGQVITSSCAGCQDENGQTTYVEGDRWVTSDGCQTCQCLQSVTLCSGCAPANCSHPDTSSCCPTCSGCTYEGTTYANDVVFKSAEKPCDRCKCMAGEVRCSTDTCPRLSGCRDLVTPEGTCCPVCLSCDDKRNGERWYEGDCNSCICQDGVKRCTAVTCGEPACTHPVNIPGVCCPQCQACNYFGFYYSEGETFSPDGCQQCNCRGGNVTCQEPACPVVDCPAPFTSPGSCCPSCLEGCEYSGRRYDEGAVFTPSFNPCMNCTCSDHKVRCGTVSCPPTPELSCSKPVALPGSCCPSFCATCMYEGVEYNDHESFRPVSNPCNTCVCYNGMVSCRNTARCTQTCSYGVFREGECCPQCTDCQLDNVIHAEGSTFTHTTNEGCTVCTCRAGNLQCEPPQGQCPPTDCQNPVKEVDSCCAVCPGCSNGKRHGDKWRDEKDSCLICECLDERVDCHPEPCPIPGDCLETAASPDSCCPVCTDCVSSDGRRYRNGTRFQPVNQPCEQCSCVNGETQCERQRCPAIDCDHSVTLPGHCCPTCVIRECDYKGRTYNEGERFDDDCRECQCTSGSVRCLPKRCPPLICQNPVQTGCCPSCDACLVDGQYSIPLGELVYNADTCQNCTCLSGTLVCHQITCQVPDIDCQIPQVLQCCQSECEPRCEVNGHEYNDNEVIAELNSECSTCRCESGSIKCSPVECPDVSCDSPVTLDCCPVCPPVCVVDGTTYQDRERIPRANLCETCSCDSGEMICDVIPCEIVRDCTSFEKVEGECCDKCTSCFTYVSPGSMLFGNPPVPLPWDEPIQKRSTDSNFIRREVKDGEKFTNHKTCEDCSCNKGDSICQPIICPPVLCSDPVIEGCCPVCQNIREGGCFVNGTWYDDGESMPSLSLNDLCSTCRCNNGGISCDREFCPPEELCREVRPRPGECCPTCVGCVLFRASEPSIELQSASANATVLSPSLDDSQIDTAGKRKKRDVEIIELWDGESHTDYETCEVCTCSAGMKLCEPIPCPAVSLGCPVLVNENCCLVCKVPLGSCFIDGKAYNNTDLVPSANPCTKCHCANGFVACTQEVCPVIPENSLMCRELRQEPDECCPRCVGCITFVEVIASPTIFGQPPDDSWTEILGQKRRKRELKQTKQVVLWDEESVENPGACQTCTCMAGRVTCEPTKCEERTLNCTHPGRDRCGCPECLGCEVDGELITIYQFVPKYEDKCTQCVCYNGNVFCKPLPCPEPECHTTRTVLDDCNCPVCSTTCQQPEGTFNDGERWINNDHCPCICEEGEAICASCSLDSLSCYFTERAEDTCCGFRCSSCQVNGVSYASGATWTENDCSRTCSCTSGIVTCMEHTTPNESCGISSPQDCLKVDHSIPSCCGNSPSCVCRTPEGTSLNVGQTFRLNSTSLSDSCTLCTCVQYQSTSYLECLTPVCPSVVGCPRDKLKSAGLDSCCPVCEDVLPTCDDAHSGESSVSSIDPCLTCTCTDSTWNCERLTCPAIDCPHSELLTQPDQCCPLCAGCYTDSVRKAHGSSWQHDLDPCATCKCDYGDIICETVVQCPPLFCTEGRKPFTPEGECCQICGDPVAGDDCLDNRGSTRAHGSGWPLDDCTVCECLYGKLNCTSERCPQTDCLSDETLVIEPGVCCPKCVKQPAICKVYGDPHYKTFDGETVHFQGFCSYEMVKDCDSDRFKIVAVHDDRDTLSVSWIKAMILYIGDLTVKFGQGLWAEVNGVNVSFPFQHSPGVVIRQLPASLQLSSETLGIKVTWDGSAYGEVEADTSLKSQLCGICGNFNDNPSDDLTMKDGILTSSHAQYGESWLVEGSQCSAKTQDINPCDVVGYEVKRAAIEQCSLIQSELFQPCHRVVPPDDYVYSCVYDMCACNNTESCLCDILTTYSSACANSYVNIQWRTAERCAMDCDQTRGFLFDECGPACPKTCDNFNEPIKAECLRPCEPSCQCPAGLVQHNGRCIEYDMCP